MRISLTDFVDVVSKAGSPKATKISQIKGRSNQSYRPYRDFYKQLRDAVVATHKRGFGFPVLEEVLSSCREPIHMRRFMSLLAGYGRWWGRKQMTWFCPPSAIYVASGVSVSVNPELGLTFGGRRHVIKLYFKQEPLKKSSADLIIELMEASLQPQDGDALGVLDVERGKLFLRSERPNPALMAMVDAELAYIAQIWPALSKAA